MHTKESILISSPNRWDCQATQLEGGGAQIGTQVPLSCSTAEEPPGRKAICAPWLGVPCQAELVSDLSHHSEALTTEAPALEPSRLASSVWSPRFGFPGSTAEGLWGGF